MAREDRTKLDFSQPGKPFADAYLDAELDDAGACMRLVVRDKD